MVKFLSLSSGSSGNCYFLGTENDGVLIDAGVSLRRLKQGLEANGLSLNSFSAILVTHDHLDHIRHLGSYCKKLQKPVYTTRNLHSALSRHTHTRDHYPSCGHVLEKDTWNALGEFSVRFFVVPHDATQTVGYAIAVEQTKFVIMTDTGRVTKEAIDFATQADTVVIESNYDVDMLMGGPYTHELKMRIMQGNGHISNEECAAAIARFMHPGLKRIFLCHLSENNNTAKLAYDCSAAILDAICADPNERPELRTLPRTSPSPLFIL